MYRNSSFELLRLLLMVLIVIHHCIVHGLGLSGLSLNYDIPIILAESQMKFAFIINAFCICAVNCFILISGYFSINTSAKRFFNLILSLIFYTFFFSIIPYAIEGKWKSVLSSCLFLSHSPYWFVIDYLFLMIFAPIINLSFEKLSTSKRRLIIIGLILISCYFGFLWSHRANIDGYTILQFITMYCIGREIKISKIEISIQKSTIVYLGASLLLGAIGWFCWNIGKTGLAWRSTFYNDPLLIISSVGLFMLFKHIKYRSRLINRLAESAFGIYLFQSSNFIGSTMYYWMQRYGMNFGNWIFCLILALAVACSVVAIVFDSIRIRLLKISIPYLIQEYKHTLSTIQKYKSNVTEFQSKTTHISRSEGGGDFQTVTNQLPIFLTCFNLNEVKL